MNNPGSTHFYFVLVAYEKDNSYTYVRTYYYIKISFFVIILFLIVHKLMVTYLHPRWVICLHPPHFDMHLVANSMRQFHLSNLQFPHPY